MVRKADLVPGGGKGELMEEGGVRCDLVGLRRAQGWEEPQDMGMYGDVDHIISGVVSWREPERP